MCIYNTVLHNIFNIVDGLSKIDQELKEINAKITKLQKRKTELSERKEKLKQLSYQKQTKSISDQNKWTHTGNHSYKFFEVPTHYCGILLFIHIKPIEQFYRQVL